MDREHDEGMTSQDHENQEWQGTDLVYAALALLLAVFLAGLCVYGGGFGVPAGGF